MMYPHKRQYLNGVDSGNTYKNVLVYFMPTIDAFKNGICIAESVLIVKMKYTLDISTIGSTMEYLYLIMVYILY